MGDGYTESKEMIFHGFSIGTIEETSEEWLRMLEQ